MEAATVSARGSLLPSPEEAAELVPRPGTIVWRYAGDARPVLAAGYALMLQVSHPVVGAGVSEHSDFASDPWGRLFRTLDFANLLVYGGPDAAVTTGRWVREMHKRIRGVMPDGRRYSALEREPYAWVHATLAEAVITGHRHFGRPLSPADADGFWKEWRGLGRLLGIRLEDLPADWPGFGDYFDRMVRERLEETQSVRDVLAALERPARPPLRVLGERTWRALRLPPARAMSLATVGLMPPALRRRLGLRWTRAQDLELRALGAIMRATTPVLPPALRTMGPGYLRMRREPIERSYLAGTPGLPAPG